MGYYKGGLSVAVVNDLALKMSCEDGVKGFSILCLCVMKSGANCAIPLPGADDPGVECYSVVGFFR